MNVVVLMAGSSAFGGQEAYPFYLTEIRGQIMLERQLKSCLPLAPSQVIFCVRADDIKKYRERELRAGARRDRRRRLHGAARR